MKENSLCSFFLREGKRLCTEECGGGIIEVILILVILLAFIIMFKDHLVTVMENASKEVDERSDTIIETKKSSFLPPMVIS